MQIERFPESSKNILNRIKGVRTYISIGVLSLFVAVMGVLWNSCDSHRAYDLQKRDSMVRNRSMISISITPAVKLGYKKDEKDVIYKISNTSEIPAVNISVMSEVFIDEKSVERSGPTSYARLDKENSLLYEIPALKDANNKYVRVKMLIWYEVVSDAGDGWFESALEETLLLDNQTVTEQYTNEKAHWGEKRSAGDSDIYRAFLNMNLRDLPLK